MTWLSIGGLILDIVGVILLFFYGPPPPVIGGKPVAVVGSDGNLQTSQASRWHIWIGRIALVLIVLGFVLQIFAAHVDI